MSNILSIEDKKLAEQKQHESEVKLAETNNNLFEEIKKQHEQAINNNSEQNKHKDLAHKDMSVCHYI